MMLLSNLNAPKLRDDFMSIGPKIPKLRTY